MGELPDQASGNISKVRVVRLIARMNVGGPAVEIAALASRLPKDKFEHTLITGYCDDSEIDFIDLHQIDCQVARVEGLGRSINLLNDLKVFFKVRLLLKEKSPHILHTHTFKAGLIGRLAALSIRHQPKLVHTYHGHLLQGYLSRVKLILLTIVERTLANYSDSLISVGIKVRDDLLARGIGPKSKFTVILPGFDINDKESLDSGETDISWDTNQFKCAWVGRVVDIKRPERIVEIARVIKDSQLDIGLFVVGGGPLLEATKSNCVIESLPVTFLGWQKNVYSILKKVDLLILTSENEGTPISIIEAQRLGKPVVVTDVGSVKEVMIHGKSGFAIDYDAEEFVENISYLSKNPEIYNQFSEFAFEFSNTLFSADRFVKEHVHLYEKLVNP